MGTTAQMLIQALDLEIKISWAPMNSLQPKKKNSSVGRETGKYTYPKA